MKTAIAGLLSSKKALTAIAATVSAVIARIGFDVPSEEIVPIIAPIVAYIVGQGLADHGKETAKINNDRS